MNEEQMNLGAMCPACGVSAATTMRGNWVTRRCSRCGWKREFDIEQLANEVLEEEANHALEELQLSAGWSK